MNLRLVLLSDASYVSFLLLPGGSISRNPGEGTLRKSRLCFVFRCIVYLVFAISGESL